MKSSFSPINSQVHNPSTQSLPRHINQILLMLTLTSFTLCDVQNFLVVLAVRKVSLSYYYAKMSLFSLLSQSVLLQLNRCLKIGKPFQTKLKSLRKDLAEKKATSMIISMLDEVAWLFNLRGSDIDYNPVFFAYALVTPESSTLYINEKKLTKEVFIPISALYIPR